MDPVFHYIAAIKTALIANQKSFAIRELNIVHNLQNPKVVEIAR